jgi:polygalacturonase
MQKLFLKIFLLTVLSQGALCAKDYNASLFGIKSDGITLNTQSIQKAIDFISEKGGGKLKFYVGRYLTGSVQLKSNVSIELNEGAVLVGTTSIYDYIGVNNLKALIMADGQQNIGITGKGVIEGQGAGVIEQITKQIQKGYLKASIAQASPGLIALSNCSGINIEGINLQNATGSFIAFSSSKQINVKGISIKKPATKESKALVLKQNDGIKLENLFIETTEPEIQSDGQSKNITLVNCKNASGKNLMLKN